MRKLKPYYGWIFLLLTVLAIRIFALFPAAVERYYSTGLYPLISRVLRWLFGWLPISIGDLLYTAVAIWLLHTIYRGIRGIWQKKVNKAWLIRSGMRVMKAWLWIYIIFNLNWGLNYNRLGIAYQMGIRPGPYTTEELESLVSRLVIQLNALRDSSLADRDPLRHKKTLFTNAFRAYRNPSGEAVFLRYGGQSVKPSLYSYLGNYLGFTGYYNPFTGEAQVNTTVPVFVQPFTTCHEIGHQLGYAKENEANLAGYLTASASGSPAFRYSASFDLYLYAIRDLFGKDSVKARAQINLLSPAVKQDIQELREFNLRHTGLFEPVVRILYAEFLRANQQPGGMMSYNQVVGMVIALDRQRVARTAGQSHAGVSR
ncbi:DUF3810 domain-containing protein [Flavihumibacter petaseus]|uniref:DUF3810 domain-containing protein n=1 Tax=Flavihumibacter petaseus NBRC 106054 TaxID=1220578 RepID=A0A0E9MZM8_9BACT|nr:DUF3810 domain-containing protein [Flavihumibacter petaseus]GAO42978.1 hypothetical protein FPE01S_02_00830 [Flavihumibacter petaseus NBRC 106054]